MSLITFISLHLMLTKQHSATQLNGFIVVEVTYEDIADYGEEVAWQVVADQDWVAEQDQPLALVYLDENNEVGLYGEEEAVQALSAIDYEDIVWSRTITIDWPEEGDEISYPAAVLADKGLVLVAVDVEDIGAYGEAGAWQCVATHEWVKSHNLPLVICYLDKRDRPRVYGPDSVLEAARALNLDEVQWEAAIVIDWPETYAN